ncbi:unnamed protein product, partial [Polarella glacialis]
YDLNTAFWGRYENIPSMALASEKQDILQITENFALIHRKHIYLFQRLKNTVLRTLDLWSAPDFAALCQTPGDEASLLLWCCCTQQQQQQQQHQQQQQQEQQQQ